MPVELDGLSQVRKKILRIVASGIKMELVGNSFGQELFMHLLCGGCETIFILLPAINVDCLSSDLRLVLACQKKRIVLVPVRDINWIPEYISQQLGEWPSIVKVRIKFAR